MNNPLLGSGVPPGAIRFVLDPELPPGWCRFTGRDGLEYGGPLSDIPKGTTTGDMTIAGDIWDVLGVNGDRRRMRLRNEGLQFD